jgi:hypothetical protein
LPFDVKNLVRSLISHGDSVIDLVWQSDGVSTLDYNIGGSGLLAMEVTPAPETATWMMMLVGFGAMGAAMQVTRRKNGLTLSR